MQKNKYYMGEKKSYKNIYIFTNIAPHYRERLWLSLLGLKGYNYNFVVGNDSIGGIKCIDFKKNEFKQYFNRITLIKNVWVYKKKIMIWQHGVIKKCLYEKINTAIFLGHMYCLSTWIAIIICKIKGIQVVFWGHGVYGNEGKFKLAIKKIFFSLAHKHLLYERRAKALMSSMGFDKNKLYVVFNSLDYETHLGYRAIYKNIRKRDVLDCFDKPELPTIIFIGRLTEEKKLEMLFRAVSEINKDYAKINLLIIGDGPERKKHEKNGLKSIQAGCLCFKGAIYDENDNARYISASDLCVSPGNVGLTAIHSLSYGTPVCTHCDLSSQMPEAAAIIDGYNGFFFIKDDVDDLKEKIESWFSVSKDRLVIKKQCYEIIDSYYNPQYQLKVFAQLIEGVDPEI